MSDDNSLRVLLIEDEGNLVDLYKVALASLGEVRTASCINDAIAAVQQSDWTPSIILLDLIMPRELDGELEFSKRAGFEVLTHIREQAHLQGVPVIVMTNLDAAEDRAQATEMGAADYIIKSNVLPKDILELIRQHT